MAPLDDPGRLPRPRLAHLTGVFHPIRDAANRLDALRVRASPRFGGFVDVEWVRRAP